MHQDVVGMEIAVRDGESLRLIGEAVVKLESELVGLGLVNNTDY